MADSENGSAANASGGDAASVEEILESIKRVMERDRPAAKPARSGAPAAGNARNGAARSGTDDTSKTDEHGDHQDAADEEVLDLADMELPQASQPNVEIDMPLVGEEVRGAMQQNLAALAMLSEPGAKPQIVRSGETSLEGLTRELLRPMLAEWLDKNLPGMVEKMVQAEIARIAGKRR
ncbi:DUF2497 domain-containing protein [Erythrobacter sp.]|jgi:cell pole-organizing protein PopZ|uniref:DUF2497 domain-containing protein n=1 Tax=Erythrobacter sp. TaxID=1042 RepID=UPI002EA335B0|nr:DUF2497 domain-containing protein [Erythrobacter sp.]